MENSYQKTNQKITNSKFVFNIDRGGTFTDFFVQQINLNYLKNSYQVLSEYSYKVPSQSLSGQGPIIGIKQFLLEKKLIEKNSQKISQKYIERINLGTTIATNALLQRKGIKNAMIMTKGFKDLFKIRHQARPNIFDLKCLKPSPLCQQSFEINQRIFVKQPSKQQMSQKITLKESSEEIYIKKINKEQIQNLAKIIIQKDIKSVGIAFCNSFLHKQNQQICEKILLQNGIQNIQKSCIYPQIGYLKRAQTTNLNAFLNPILSKYFANFAESFEKPQDLNLQIMKSQGGFAKFKDIKASELLLSGPAGGLIGYSKMIQLFQETSNIPINNLIGLDMGGTSTDVSRIQNRQFSMKYVFQVQGIQICTPNLEIDTIAAGGGSKLNFQNGMFKVGPQSVGSNPGPVCYGIGEQLALTDANLVLNRLNADYFPKIFGKNQNQTLSRQKSQQVFEILSKKINMTKQKESIKSIEEIAQGYIQIANELMAKSARKLLTFGKPDALVIFGSAGGQHCCDLAQKIGVQDVFIHRYSGILSAYGLSLASQTKQFKFYIGKIIQKQQFCFKQWQQILINLKTNHRNLKQQIVFQPDEVKTWIGIGYVGTSHTILVPFQQNLLQVFEQKHKKQNGFTLSGKKFRFQFIREVYYKHPPILQRKKENIQKQDIMKFKIKEDNVFISGKWKLINFYDITDMRNCQISEPCVLLSKTSSILIKENFKVFISKQLVYIRKMNSQRCTTLKKSLQVCDPIKLTLYSTRLMAIAQQMGKILQKISISTNIKQRLDFSCGLFDWNGRVLANAPHIPVHLGSMQTAVIQQIKRGIKNGDVILSNHPKAGGSHLPDLTVITCIQINNLRLFVASRGHHADIGGIAPGSMPPFSKYLSQQGLAVQKFQLMNSGIFKQKQVRQLFKNSRRIQDNISDLLAQIAANQLGIRLIQKFISQQGQDQFRQYIKFICSNAQESVRCLLVDFSLKNKLKQIQTIQNQQFMDDGTKIKLSLTINRKQRSALFDFTGTQVEVLGNTNAPQSITRSAIIYSLRSLIGIEIPLNSGCLTPIQIIIPKGSILSPSRQAAVVGGNVQTSQRLVDLILKPFKYVAASQGTMNNFLFGTKNLTYYETICGGTGAGNGFNGNTVQCHMTNTRITDVQQFQKLYPAILKQFSLRKRSGGKGKYFGGDGVIRQFLFLQEAQVSILSERRVFWPYGLNGGQSGQRGKNYLIKNKKNQNQDNCQQIIKSLGGKNSIVIQKYDVIRIQTPGGGGYGKLQIAE